MTLDSLGEFIRRESMPWQQGLDLDPMVTQGRVSSSTDGRWAYAFSFGPGWYGFRSHERQRYTGRFVEPMPFPTLARTGDGGVGTSLRLVGTQFAARDVDVDSSVVYVLYSGLTNQANALVDRYEWNTGTYLGTVQLPAPAYRLRVFKGIFYVLFTDPYPELVAMKPLPAS